MQTGTIQANNKSKTARIISLLAAGCFLLPFAWSSCLQAETSVVATTSWFVDMGRYKGAAHGTLECEECHGPMIGKTAGKNTKHPDPKAIDLLKTEAKRNFDYQVCNNCHESEHVIAALKEIENWNPSKPEFATTCGDCHSAHYPKSPSHGS